MAHRLRLGVAGLGRAFMLMLPTFARHPDVALVAAADPRAEAREAFAADFGGNAYATVDELCRDADVEAIYIATPHQHHVAHVTAAARNGKHILVEKPMALTLGECDSMIDAARQARVHLVVGHSHSFDSPYLRAAQIIRSGRYGAVRMITAMNFTDFLYRPRRPEELVTEQGGGVVFSQAAHQVDVVRLLGGGPLRSVRAATGRWDPQRPADGAYQALLTFENGATASLTYSGYGRFDTDELMGWIGEMGQRKDAARYGAARALLKQAANPAEETALKNARTYGVQPTPSSGTAGRALHNHFGVVIVSCERADLRPLPSGVQIFEDETQRLEELAAPEIPRFEVVEELFAALRDNRAPIHSGEWGRATLEACLAILQSARTGREVSLVHQIGLPDESQVEIP